MFLTSEEIKPVRVKQDRLSKTAAFIAVKFYGMTLDKPYRELFDKETLLFYERLVASLPGPLNKFHYALHNQSIRKWCTYVNEWLLPGDLMHILSRKFYIPKKVDELLEEGFEQLVILGAGFDHLATKYSAGNVSCFEIDTPAMTEAKQHFAKKYGYNSDKLTLHAARLSHDSVPEILSSVTGLNPEKRTVVIAEGFFDYLSATEANNVVSGITSFFNKKLVCISTVFALEELPSFHAFTFKTGVRIAGEQLRLHYNMDDYTRLLESNGLVVLEKLAAMSMKSNMPVFGKNSFTHLPGFYLLKALSN